MKTIETLREMTFDFVDYSTYLESWLNGIESEFLFWKYGIENKCPEWNNDWKYLISDDRKFNLEQYLNKEKEINFLDVGSGPFSTIGKYTEKTILHYNAVDPLAFLYGKIKKNNKITTGIIPEYCMVERLLQKYGENQFDIVHIANALDHSFNPLIGIIQMLGVCKKGGKIILKHRINEAESADYQGFHQWNLCVENNSFLIWRKGIIYNVSKMFEKYADVYIEHTANNFLVIVVNKKDDIYLDTCVQSKIINILDEKIFNKLLEFIWEKKRAKKYKSKKYKLRQFIKGVPILGKLLTMLYRKAFVRS